MPFHLPSVIIRNLFAFVRRQKKLVKRKRAIVFLPLQSHVVERTDQDQRNDDVIDHSGRRLLKRF